MNRKTGPHSQNSQNSPVSRVVPLAVVFMAMLGLSSCGGGGGGSGSGGSGGGGDTIITPPSDFYGAIKFGDLPGSCSTGWSAGIATGYSSRSAADSAARNQCSRAGGTDCRSGNTNQFGSAYASGSECIAAWIGETGSTCRIGAETGATVSAAESAALSECRGRYGQCDIQVSVCSTAGPANSYSRVFSTGGNTGGGGDAGGGNTGGGNQAPVVAQRLTDGTVQQGGTLRYSRISGVFSDPDGDRLTITASSNATGFATVRVSGDDLIITGVQAFTTGAVTITVTARDPSGLTAIQNFAVLVTAPDNGAPVVRGSFGDGTVEEGEEITYANISRQFSDPDGDQLRFTATSSHPSYATARISGDTLHVRGVQSFTSGSVRITVTARDPGGLTASTTFSVRVSAQPDLWAAIAVGETEQNCRSSAAGYAWDYSSRRSAERDALSQCRSGGGNCLSGRVVSWRNGCGAFAEGDGCGGGWTGGHDSRSSAERQALSLCRQNTQNCSVVRSICTSNVR